MSVRSNNSSTSSVRTLDSETSDVPFRENFGENSTSFSIRNYTDVFGSTEQFASATNASVISGQSSDYRYASHIQSSLFRQDTSDAKMRLDAIDNVRVNGDFFHAWDLQRYTDIYQSDKGDAHSLIEGEAPPPYEQGSAAQVQPLGTKQTPEVSAKFAWIIPIAVGVIAGAVVGTATHAAWQGAQTAGGAAIADYYHEIASEVHNEYLDSQLQTLPGQKYVGHFNYMSSMAALNDARDQAAPWLTWGEGAALNHFKTENHYDKMEFKDNNGFALNMVNE